MRHIKVWLFSWTVLIVFGLTSFVSGAAVAAGQTPFGQFRWPTTTVTYYIGSTSTYYRGIFQKAIARWNHTHVVTLVSGSKQRHQLLLTTTASTRGSYGDLAGIAYENHAASGYFTDAQVYLMRTNLRAFHYSRTQRQAVAEHEIGHAFGLEHSTEGRSVMVAGNRNNLTITAADRAGLRLRYRTPAWQASDS